jgi:hypothetical protein
MDLPAETIGPIYRQHWMVELLCFHTIGWADEQDLQEHIDKLQTMDG